MKNKFGRLLLFVICVLYMGIFMGGCATIIEGAKGIVGVSTKVLEDNRNNAIKKTFNCDYNTCYHKTEEILGHLGAYIYNKDSKKQLIAVYVSQEDTTPVGIFFKAIDTTNTQLEVSSASTSAKELISTNVFFGLEKALNPKKEKDELNAPEGTGNK